MHFNRRFQSECGQGIEMAAVKQKSLEELYDTGSILSLALSPYGQPWTPADMV